MINIVTIISIFIAITIGMVSGISFSLQAFSSLTSNNLFNLCVIALVVGFVIFNLFYAIFKFVTKICGKDIDKNGYIVLYRCCICCINCIFCIYCKIISF